MPYKEREIEKLYFTIGEVAALLNIKSTQIRFWHKHFDIIKPHTNKHGNRMFTKKDIEVVRKIHELINIKGFTLQGAQQYLQTGPDMFSDNREKVIAYLRILREKLLQMKSRDSFD